MSQKLSIETPPVIFDHILLVKNSKKEHWQELVRRFLDNAGDSLKTFRYFAKRPLCVINNHIVTLFMYPMSQLFEDHMHSPVAYGHIDKDVNGDAWLGICVVEKYRGQGYGRSMMDCLIKYANLYNVRKIRLAVDKDNIGAYNLYQKCGFKDEYTNDSMIFMSLSAGQGE